MDYTLFEKYPIQILGIDETHNDKLNAIKEVVIDEIEYSGELSDIESVLPYFVFFKFCDDLESDVTANAGEQTKASEFSTFAYKSQISAWNQGVKKLQAICTERGTRVAGRYLSKISYY